MIEQLLPKSVASAETTAQTEDIALFPEEERYIRNCAPRRQDEFRAARACARRALATLRLPPVPLVPAADGQPTWPEGFVGSMSHCPGYRVAALAPTAEVLALGIDAEPDQPLPEGLLEVIGRPEEITLLRTLTRAGSPVCGDRLLFSAKESVYKAWFPLTGRPLDFPECTLTFGLDGTFAARLLVPGPKAGGQWHTGFEGRWLAEDGLVLTAITVEGTANH